MILLDTNVISELMRPQPNSNVIEWLDEQFSHKLLLEKLINGEKLENTPALRRLLELDILEPKNDNYQFQIPLVQRFVESKF